jgi:predicted anti-sigma-YlaC factor YlaD
MTCDRVREQLLACETPERPGATLSAHLRECPACQVWLRRLVRLERQLPQVPVEVPPVPAALFEALELRPTRLPSATPARSREGARGKAALASSLAAALLLFAIGWWAWPYLGSGPATQQRDYAQRRDAHLAGFGQRADHAQALLGLADQLLTEANAAQAKTLAESLEQLLEVDLPPLADAVPVGQRADVLQRLSRLESRTERLASLSRNERLSEALKRSAESVRRADRRLRTLWGV